MKVFICSLFICLLGNSTGFWHINLSFIMMVWKQFFQVLSVFYHACGAAISGPLLINCSQDPGGEEERTNCVLNLALSLSLSYFPSSDSRADWSTRHMNINATCLNKMLANLFSFFVSEANSYCRTVICRTSGTAWVCWGSIFTMFD